MIYKIYALLLRQITNTQDFYMEKIRIQKYLSQAGVCSRRKAEDYISRWLVEVNGTTAEIGQSIDPSVDVVKLWDKAVKEQKELVYYKMNKPRGIETTCAQDGQNSIIDIIDIKTRVFPIGRLDKETTGLIILTNDGRLANYLMHPRYEHKKEYVVEVFGPIKDEELETLRQWVYILWKYTNKAEVERVSSWTFKITISEWRNRQIRRMVEKVGSMVKRLKRIRIENVELWNLEEWEYKALSKGEKKALFDTLNLDN